MTTMNMHSYSNYGLAVAAALLWPACSLQTANQVSCTEDTECVAAFGEGAVCQADGFCTPGQGAGGVDGGGGGGGGGDDDGAVNGDGAWTFVSIPNFINADIGDVSDLTGSVNSTNEAHEAVIDAVLDAIAAEKPDFVLVAGDLVSGHWHLDASGEEVFGPVGTLEEQAQAVARAADTYYSQWKERFSDRGLTVYPAVGDHEIGGYGWPTNSNKARLVGDFKEAWARHFTRDGDGDPRFAIRPEGSAFEGTAYAVRHKNLLAVTVDVFRQANPSTTIDPRTGSVRADLQGAQLVWLESVLEDAVADPEIDHVLVQGHVPVLVPVRTQGASGLTMPGADGSEFWQALERFGVDLYLAGEVHDMTAANSGGVEQVVHGGGMGYGTSTSYLVGRVHSNRIELELKSAELVHEPDDDSRLWQAGHHRPRAAYEIGPEGFESAGTMLVDKRSANKEYRDRTGPFVPLGDSAEDLVVHLRFDEALGSALTLNHGTSGSANNGQVQGVSFVSGKFGNAALFNANDRIMAGSTPILGSTSRTTAVWVKLDSKDSVIRTPFAFGDNKPGNKWDFDISEENAKDGIFEVGVGDGRLNSSGSPAVVDDEWHHLVAVLPEGATTLGELELYVDGEPIAHTTDNPVHDTREIDTLSGRGLIVGHSVNPSPPRFQQYDGLLDDLAIWARPLSAAKVRALSSLANREDLNYDAGEVEALFLAFAAGQDVRVRDRLWRYRSSGLSGGAGVVVDSGGQYSINLGGGAGFVSP